MALSVTDLQPNDSPDSPFDYTFKVQCTSCREIHPNWVTVNRFASYPIANNDQDELTTLPGLQQA
jgi:hypothetical protein